jgi:hypothetical protein
MHSDFGDTSVRKGLMGFDDYVIILVAKFVCHLNLQQFSKSFCEWGLTVMNSTGGACHQMPIGV